MATTIVQHTIGTTTNYASQSNSRFARPLPFSTTWTKLRIAVRWGLTDSGANLTSTPGFAVGVCSGTSNIYGDATVTNFCGVINNAATLTRATGPIRYTGLGLRPGKKVNTTQTLGGTNVNASLYQFITIDASVRTALFVDITKGSPNYTFDIFYPTNSAVADISMANFLAQVELTTPALTNYTYSVTAGSSQTLAVDESAGTFDTLNFYWDRTVSTLDSDELYIVRLQ